MEQFILVQWFLSDVSRSVQIIVELLMVFFLLKAAANFSVGFPTLLSLFADKLSFLRRVVPSWDEISKQETEYLHLKSSVKKEEEALHHDALHGKEVSYESLKKDEKKLLEIRPSRFQEELIVPTFSFLRSVLIVFALLVVHFFL